MALIQRLHGRRNEARYGNPGSDQRAFLVDALLTELYRRGLKAPDEDLMQAPAEHLVSVEYLIKTTLRPEAD